MVKLAYVALTLAVGTLCSWVAFLLFGGAPHFEWVAGVGQVPAMYMWQILRPAMAGAALGANLVAGTFCLYRTLRYGEV